MILLYTILGILIVSIILTLVIPLKIKIQFNMNSNNKNNNENLNLINKVDIYILRKIRLKTIYKDRNDKTNEKNQIKNNKSDEEKNVINDIAKALENYIKYEKKDSFIISKEDITKLKKGLKFEEFYLSLGFNLKEPILNAYLIAFLNMVINMYIANNANHFNFEKTKYQTYISNKIIDLKFYSIINFKLVNNIIIIFKLIFNLRKVVNKNGKTTSN